MDPDTQDKARKLTDQLRESQRKGAKDTKFTADQTKILIKAYDELSDMAASASKNIRELGKELTTVTDAFENPASTFSDILHEGLRDGQGLLKTFGAIAGLMFDGPIKKANEELEKQQKILDGIPKMHEDEIKSGEDAIKQLEEKLKNEKELCDKITKCDESKMKSLSDQLKKEQDKLATTKNTPPLLKNQNDLYEAQRKKQQEIVDKAKATADKLKQNGELAKKMLSHFADAFDRFVDLDHAAADFRKELGLGRDTARQLEQTALQLNQQFVTLGVTIQGAYKSLVAIGQVLGTSLLINKELAQTTALLAANYGVSEKTAAGFLQKMSAIGGMTDKQASAMAGFTANLANAAGVNLDEVMSDVASASDDTVTLMRGNVKQMTLAAIQAKQMGVSLDRSASSAKGLLNFTQSVSDEMEASVLLGKNLNLNSARQLSFQGDVAGAQKEILNQVRQMGDFNKMNVFQQEALAKATGYSAVELTKMLKNEEKLAQLSEKEKASYEKALDAMKEQNEETGKDLLMKTQMQSSMAQLNNTFAAFKQILADILTPVVNVAVKLLIPALKLALLVFNLILVPVKVLANALYKMFEPLEPVVQSISDAFDGINGKIEEAVQYSVPLGVILLKIATPLGWMITSFTGISKLIISIGRGVAIMGASFQRAGGMLKPIGDVFIFIAKQIREVGKTGDVLIPIFNTTAKMFKMISGYASGLLGPIRGFITGFGSAAGTVGKFASGFGSITKVVGILSTAGKAIPMVGQVITVLQAAYGMITRLMSGMGFFEALGETLYDVFVGPFEMLVELLTKIPIIGDLFKPLLTIFPVIKSSIVSVFKIFETGWESIKDLFSGKDIVKNLLNIGKMVLVGMYLVPSIIFKSIVGIFPSIVDKIKGIFSGGGIGSMILSVLTFPIKMFFAYIKLVFVQIPKFIWTAITTVFTTISEWISSIDIFGGLWDGIKSLGSGIMSVFTSSFGDAVSWVTGLFSGDDSGGMFSGIMDSIQNIGTTITDTFSGVGDMMGSIFSGVKSVVMTIIEPFQLIANVIQNIGELLINNFFKGLTSIAQFIGGVLAFPFKLIAKVVGVDTSGISGETNASESQSDGVVKAIAETNQKLDTLIGLMMSGGIAVNLDGRKVSEQLAIASS